MAHDHIIYDSDPHFSIDVDTRAISYVSPEKLVLVQEDHNSEIFTFDMPRFADGHDMLECDIKQIHYINLDSERGILKSTGVYTITDMKQSDEDENKVVFSWTISKNATKYVGSLSFAARFACSGEESTLDYDWKTLPYASVPVSKTILNIDDFVEDNYDALQDWYNGIMQGIDDEVAKVGGIKVSSNEPTTKEAIAWLNPDSGILKVKNKDGEFKALESIKGDSGGCSINGWYTGSGIGYKNIVVEGMNVEVLIIGTLNYADGAVKDTIIYRDLEQETALSLFNSGFKEYYNYIVPQSKITNERLMRPYDEIDPENLFTMFEFTTEYNEGVPTTTIRLQGVTDGEDITDTADDPYYYPLDPYKQASFNYTDYKYYWIALGTKS